MIDAGDSQMILKWSKNHPGELLFKDRNFVSGRGIGSGSGIAKRFKDPAQ